MTPVNDVDILTYTLRGNYYWLEIARGKYDEREREREILGEKKRKRHRERKRERLGIFADLLFLSDFLNCTAHERERCLRDVNEIMGPARVPTM